jgi:hypothetical protein
VPICHRSRADRRHQQGRQRIRVWNKGKKLTDAAQFWARGGQSSVGGLAEDLKQFGVSAEQRRELLGEYDDNDDEEQSDDFEVWPENWPAVVLFLTCATQWNCIAGMGPVIRQGLRYEAVLATLSVTVADSTQHADIFAGLRRMESAALAVFHEKK